MKKQAGLEGLYERWDKFSDKQINPSIDLINAKTDISVFWEPLKKGRSVYGIIRMYTSQLIKPHSL